MITYRCKARRRPVIVRFQSRAALPVRQPLLWRDREERWEGERRTPPSRVDRGRLGGKSQRGTGLFLIPSRDIEREWRERETGKGTNWAMEIDWISFARISRLHDQYGSLYEFVPTLRVLIFTSVILLCVFEASPFPLQQTLLAINDCVT